MNMHGDIPQARPTPPPGIALLAVELARRLDVILAGLLLRVTAEFRRLGPHAQPVWTRISRARQRLVILLANLAAGRLPRRRTPRPGRRGGPPAPYIPRGHAWLVVAIGYHAAGFASQLDAVLREPATPAILAASPGATRTINRLCRLLGITPPVVVPPVAAHLGQPAPSPHAAPSPHPDQPPSPPSRATPPEPPVPKNSPA